MTVRRGDDGVIVLGGVCPVEDAEPLLQLMQAAPDARCDWTRCSHLHTAVVQVVMAANPDLPEQMRLILILVPGILAAIAALKVCSALAVYWTVSSVYSAAQTGVMHYLIARRIKNGTVTI